MPDGRVVGESLIQSDSKLDKIPNMVVFPIMTKGMVGYRRDWIRYLTKHKNEL
jgi:hypothetical protein